jgi:hypothetical protein
VDPTRLPSNLKKETFSEPKWMQGSITKQKAKAL